MRILHVIPSLSINTGGPAVNTVALTQQMMLRGHDVTIATTNALTPAQAIAAQGGATVENFPVGAEDLNIKIFPLSRFHRFAHSRELGIYLRGHTRDFDVVHVHSLNLYPQLATWKAARSAQIPIVLSPRGALDPWIRQRRQLVKRANDLLWQRRMLNSLEVIHATSNAERDAIQAEHFLSPIKVIPNGLDIDSLSSHSFDPMQFRSRWLGGFDGPVVLNHGRLSAKKGLVHLVDAFAQLADHSEARLVFIGADDEGIGAKLLGRAKSLGIENAVTIVPGLSGTELLNAVSTAAIWVLPSYGENFGMAVIEAMALGVPVMTTSAVDTAPDAADHGALVLTSRDPQELSNVASLLLTDSERRVELGNRGRAYVRRFDWSIVGDQYEQLYQSVASAA